MRLREADLTAAAASKDRCRPSLRFLMASVDPWLENEVERVGSMLDNERLTPGPDAGMNACQNDCGCDPENRVQIAAPLNANAAEDDPGLARVSMDNPLVRVFGVDGVCGGEE